MPGEDTESCQQAFLYGRAPATSLEVCFKISHHIGGVRPKREISAVHELYSAAMWPFPSVPGDDVFML